MGAEECAKGTARTAAATAALIEIAVIPAYAGILDDVTGFRGKPGMTWLRVRTGIACPGPVVAEKSASRIAAFLTVQTFVHTITP